MSAAILKVEAIGLAPLAALLDADVGTTRAWRRPIDTRSSHARRDARPARGAVAVALVGLAALAPRLAAAQVEPAPEPLDADVAAPAAGSAAPDAAASTPEAPPAPPRRLGTDPSQPEKFEWRYPTFRVSEYVATGVFAGFAVAGLLVPIDGPRLQGRNGFDDSMRSSLRLGSRDDRKTADDFSDITLTLSINHAVFDALVVAWWGRGRGSVAYQMLAIDAEALAVTAALTSVSKAAFARERPYGRTCDALGNDAAPNCESGDRYRSFPSGHTSTAFTMASLTCIHHAYLALYDDPVADTAACVSAYGVAGATSMLRVVSDNHYTTDVIAGAALGTAVGLGVPWLLHYRLPRKVAASSPTDEISFRLIPGPGSATLLGTF